MFCLYILTTEMKSCTNLHSYMKIETPTHTCTLLLPTLPKYTGELLRVGFKVSIIMFCLYILTTEMKSCTNLHSYMKIETPTHTCTLLLPTLPKYTGELLRVGFEVSIMFTFILTTGNNSITLHQMVAVLRS